MLFKVRGYYITHVEGYIEAENTYEAQQKAKYGRHWKISPNAVPVEELSVSYIIEVDKVSPYSMFKTQSPYKGSDE